MACPDGRIVQSAVLNDEFSKPNFQYHVFLQQGYFFSPRCPLNKLSERNYSLEKLQETYLHPVVALLYYLTFLVFFTCTYETGRAKADAECNIISN